MTRARPAPSRRTALVLSVVYVSVLLAVVFSPISRGLNRLTVAMYTFYRYDLRLPGDVLPEDFGHLLNVLLFVPVGMIVVLVVRRSWWQAALVAVAVSAAVELVQLVPALHRDTSLSDVVTNGLGGLLGAGIAGYLGSRLTRTLGDPSTPGPT